MRRDLFEDFCREYVRELNRLRMEHRASLSNGRQRARVGRTRNPEAHSGDQGRRARRCRSRTSSCRSKRRKAELQSRLDAPEMPELLHPRMADVYREKVGSLCLGAGERGEPHRRRRGHSCADRGDPARTRWRPAEDHAEGRPGGNAERGQRQQEVARNRRPLGPNKAGCGGGI